MIEAINNLIASLGSWLLWSASVGALIYACFDHRETSDEIRNNQGWKRKALQLKLWLLWGVPIVGLVGAYSTTIESEKSEAKIKGLEKQITEMAKPRRIYSDQRLNLIACLSKGAKGPIIVDFDGLTGKDEAENFFKDIVSVFQEAGFWGSRSNELELVSVPVSGLLILVRNTNAPPLHALSIFRCLKENGIKDVRIRGHALTRPPETNVVGIWVSRKP